MTHSGNNPALSLVFFGNEKLITGGAAAKPIIKDALIAAGFDIEKIINGKLTELGRHRSKLAVLAAYGHIIPQRVLDEFPLGIINIHPSLLPKYRGPTPIESAMLAGETTTGVSIMKLTAEMDEGPIYIQRHIDLAGNESKEQIAKQLQALGAELLIEVLPDIAAGKRQPQPQTGKPTYTNKLNKSDGTLDPKKPALQLEREVRAYSQWPKSTLVISGKDIVVTEAETDKTKSGAIGNVFKTPSKELGVFTSDGALMIRRLKPAGKPEMSAESYLAGYGEMVELEDVSAG